MARYGKTIKMVEALTEKAFYKLKAVANRKGQEVYRIELVTLSNGEHLRVYHYNTLTLEYSLKDREIVQYYGFSGSDRDSLNTVLDYLGHDKREFFRLTAGEIILEQKTA
jgi:uncharacterized membrane protein YfhO